MCDLSPAHRCSREKIFLQQCTLVIELCQKCVGVFFFQFVLCYRNDVDNDYFCINYDVTVTGTGKRRYVAYTRWSVKTKRFFKLIPISLANLTRFQLLFYAVSTSNQHTQQIETKNKIMDIIVYNLSLTSRCVTLQSPTCR